MPLMMQRPRLHRQDDNLAVTFSHSRRRRNIGRQMNILSTLRQKPCGIDLFKKPRGGSVV